MNVDQLSFSAAIKRAAATVSGSYGIGTYGEKLLHRTLKFYFEPDEEKHEVACFGSVADIRNEEGIIEIQTRSFGRILPKLERFLREVKVTVVYPVIENKIICRINTETGESLPPRRSTKKGRPADALAEISTIRRILPNNNLKILVALVDVTETRMINGRVKVGRKRTAKIDCIPDCINRIICLESSEDYRQLLPSNLPQSFNSTEFEQFSGLKGANAHGALILLMQLGILVRERKGREPYQYFQKI